ncbi:cellobiose phosphorylase [Fervidobacterium islandicum]|uniref:cellobiose phosphorylase n=1 Tax=Fervidobacterium islandicum TaxID=2423 RepID=UPI003A6FF507
MVRYYFDENKRFVIEEYNNSKPFSSFLPGIAGKKGIPLWVFYVNRAQAIASFGIAHKDNPIMEFHPAFRSYQVVFTHGFRTFVKDLSKNTFFEPFGKVSNEKVVQRMYITRNEVELEEINEAHGLKTNVLYFMLPQENLGALIRIVKFQNISNEVKKFEILDGLPALLPYGTNDYGLKHVGNTLKAWMEVYNLENKIPVFKLRSTAEDVAAVSEFKEGNFYVSFKIQSQAKELLMPLVDPDIVFGMNTSYITPDVFLDQNLSEIKKMKQITSNKVPCAFSPVEAILQPGEELHLYTVTGHTPDMNLLKEYAERFSSQEYLERKRREGSQIIEEIVSDVWTKTSSDLFDEYTKQTYLDNVLRGGYPVVLREGSDSLVYHVYSRKHGDLERDYNYFVLLPEYYSSGNANYRDVNQNRREDVVFHPEIGNYNIRFFVNLIQADGYNPLVINGVRYSLNPDCEVEEFLKSELENHKDVEKLLNFLKAGNLTPGKLLRFIEKENIRLKKEFEEFLRSLAHYLVEETDAVHGEGFWTDHWTYNLDLIESYLSIYPETKEKLLFEDKSYTYYDNAECVLPRSKRYVFVDGKVRQYNSLYLDEDKKKLIESRGKFKNIVRTNKGKGEIYRTTLISKLVNLAAIKFATTDPAGVGIEMEAGKPGWYDALNGLPGLFGSSVAESFELLRLMNFIVDALREYKHQMVSLPIEVMNLIEKTHEIVQWYENSDEEDKDFKYWEKMSDLRESYREDVKFGFDGAEIQIEAEILSDIFDKFRMKLKAALDKAISENNGLMPTYYYYEAVEYEIINEEGNQKFVNVRKFKQRPMPLFLEGMVRGFKAYATDRELLKEICRKVKLSELYDRKLKMYKVNAPLTNETIEIGRAKAFTPGWLENESIWLHMEYKYMLELIKNGLYEEFYEDFKNVIVAFMNPEVYGRSPLENSSFIASSANPDEKIHGTGFVARLSGASAEFLSMWKIMLAGQKPFKFIDGKLFLCFEPILPGWLFDEGGKVSFNFLGKVKVTYVNPKKLDTFKVDITKQKVKLKTKNGEIVEIDGHLVPEPYAKLVRDGKIESVEVSFLYE